MHYNNILCINTSLYCSFVRSNNNNEGSYHHLKKCSCEWRLSAANQITNTRLCKVCPLLLSYMYQRDRFLARHDSWFDALFAAAPISILVDPLSAE